MLETIVVILLVLWAAGLLLHILGSFIHIVLVLAIIFAIARFLRKKKAA